RHRAADRRPPHLSLGGGGLRRLHHPRQARLLRHAVLLGAHADRPRRLDFLRLVVPAQLDRARYQPRHAGAAQDLRQAPHRPRPRGRRLPSLLRLQLHLVLCDWIMSLEPKWSTTMWGVYGFAGLFQASLALVLLFTVLFRRRQMFGGAVRDYHYVDLARIVHAFSIFMVYIGFAQYLL